MSSIVYFDIPTHGIRAKLSHGELYSFEPMSVKDDESVSYEELIRRIEFRTANCNALNWHVRNVILPREQDIFNYRSK